MKMEHVPATKRAIVSVDEIFDELNAPPDACVLPSWTLAAVCHVPGGARPSYAHGYYDRANRFYQAWDEISRDRDTFLSWIKKHILDTADFATFQKVLAETGKEQLV